MTSFAFPHSSTSPHNHDSDYPDWADIFEDGVEEDDTLWKEYLEEAAKFDRRKIDEWNKVVDVVLLFVSFPGLHDASFF